MHFDLVLFFFLNFILFLNLHNCISFAKYQNILCDIWFVGLSSVYLFALFVLW